MDAINQLLQSVDVEDVALLIGLIWGIFKGSEWYERIKNSRYLVAVEAIEAGVTEAYRRFVRDAKLESETGKLSADQRVQANQLALGIATKVAKTNGIELRKVFKQDEEIAREIEMAVARMKTPDAA